MFNLFRLCRKDEISRKTRSTLLPKNGNYGEATFDIVERIVRLVGLAFNNVALTLMLMHGRGFSCVVLATTITLTAYWLFPERRRSQNSKCLRDTHHAIVYSEIIRLYSWLTVALSLPIEFEIHIVWVPHYRRWWVYDGIMYQVKRGQAIGASLQKISKNHSIRISTKIWLMRALVWPVATTAVKAGHSERMKKHVLTLLRWKGWERFCGFHG